MNRFADIANPWVADLASYEPGRPLEEVARELGIDDPTALVKLASNENALGPSPLAIKAMQEAAGQMHRYPDGGTYLLRQAIATKLSVDPDQVLPGNGSNELLEFLGHVFLGPDTQIVMAEHAFLVYGLIAASFRAETIRVPMKRYTHDLDAMLEAITPRTRIVFISNPNNPTSTMVGQAQIDRFMERVPPHVLVCFDEAYIELLPEEKQPDILGYIREGRMAVVLRTFSKTYGLAGLRIGYAVAPADCVALLNRVRQPFAVNAMAMAAARAALEDDEHVARTRKMIEVGIRYLENEFDVLGLAFVPACANFMLVETGEGREVFERLQEHGVIVRPMDVYGLPDHIRVTVGTREENDRLLEAMGKVLS